MRNIAAALMLVIAGCSFKPLHDVRDRETGRAAEQAAAISIPPVAGPDGRHGITLRNKLLDKLTPKGRPEEPLYSLNIEMTPAAEGIYTIDQYGAATSYSVSTRVRYRLYSMAERKTLLDRSITGQATYNILSDQYSSEMLKRNAINLAIQDAAEQIYLGIITHFAGAGGE